MKQKRVWLFLILIFPIILSMYVIGTYPKESPQIHTPVAGKKLFTGLQTHQSRYNPGDTVEFKLASDVTEYRLNVSYFHLDKKLKEEEFTNKDSWSWVPPKEDFRGYLVEVKFFTEDEVQTETIAVDVSSDWSKFPRYGFLSSFNKMPYEKLEKIISTLNRYHLNGLQFYDWHYEHQQPVKLNSGSPASHWQDVANREIALQTLNHYIALAHDRNMEAMAYNLLYGSFEKRALPDQWHLYKDREQNTIDQHPPS
ncbi:glycoside hydrolase family 66 protein [Mesobacillus subterraneus]|uniref:glycoside hydrolase family 66 protein n=1 Tax=Mesobacillus subterraneus TaxID=285983 RepID=UPI00273FC3A3|nr:glycoside hydrolase family 66 protein [Mesobacillus subterraneus]WLR55662.1 glycoside hydrolase family 66 protein [Mesobacillus subterraneus]